MKEQIYAPPPKFECKAATRHGKAFAWLWKFAFSDLALPLPTSENPVCDLSRASKGSELLWTL